MQKQEEGKPRKPRRNDEAKTEYAKLANDQGNYFLSAICTGVDSNRFGEGDSVIFNGDCLEDNQNELVGLHTNMDELEIIIDSGASAHMIGNADGLTNIKPCSRTITVANGEKVIANKIGTLTIETGNNKLVLDGVLVVDGVSSTLLSIPAMMKSNKNIHAEFNHQHCTIFLDKQQIAKGILNSKSNVYVLEKGNKELANTIVDKADPAILWHSRLGHIALPAILYCHKQGIGPPNISPSLKINCSCCITSKMARLPAPKYSTRKYKPGECWVSDTKGPLNTTSIGGCRYYTIYIDAATGYKIIYFVKSTDGRTQMDNFLKVMAWSRTQTGNYIRIFRSDNGPEYKSNEFKQLLESKGITHETSAPYNQWQNGIAERAHRSIIEMALAMMAHAGLAKRWWAEAANTAVCIQNRILHSTNATQSPYEQITGFKAKLDNMRVFGCVAYKMVDKPEQRDKLAPKASKCIFLGYLDTMKAFKLYNLEQNKIVTAVHVKFCEDEFVGQRTSWDNYKYIEDNDDDEFYLPAPKQIDQPKQNLRPYPQIPRFQHISPEQQARIDADVQAYII